MRKPPRRAPGSGFSCWLRLLVRERPPAMTRRVSPLRESDARVGASSVECERFSGCSATDGLGGGSGSMM